MSVLRPCLALAAPLSLHPLGFSHPMVCGSSLAPGERALNPLLSSDPQGPLCEGEVSEHPDMPALRFAPDGPPSLCWLSISPARAAVCLLRPREMSGLGRLKPSGGFVSQRPQEERPTPASAEAGRADVVTRALTKGCGVRIAVGGAGGQTQGLPVGCAALGFPDSGPGGAMRIMVHRGACLLCLVQGRGGHFTLLHKHRGTCPEATGQGRNCPSG